MKLKDIQKLFHKALDSIYDKYEVDNFFFMLLEYYLDVKRITLALKPEFSISDEAQEPIFKALQDLKLQKPIQYILGNTAFYGLQFKVNNHVLIPRPETEELVDWILLEEQTRTKQLNILDIGTGSGCIAIALAKHLPNAKVFALDVSYDALKVAKENTEKNDVTIEFIEADILSLEREDWNLKFENLEFDIIVSNPPYVREQEKHYMKDNVLDNEPHLALFVKDDNALLFYKAITEFAVNKLKEKGLLFFEINEYLGNEMIQLLSENNFSNIQLKQDLFRKDRMIKATKTI